MSLSTWQQERLLKCGKAFLKARKDLFTDGSESDVATSSSLGSGDCFIAFDNQKPGLLCKFTDFLKDANGKKDTHSICQ